MIRYCNKELLSMDVKIGIYKILGGNKHKNATNSNMYEVISWWIYNFRRFNDLKDDHNYEYIYKSIVSASWFNYDIFKLVYLFYEEIDCERTNQYSDDIFKAICLGAKDSVDIIKWLYNKHKYTKPINHKMDNNICFQRVCSNNMSNIAKFLAKLDKRYSVSVDTNNNIIAWKIIELQDAAAELFNNNKYNAGLKLLCEDRLEKLEDDKKDICGVCLDDWEKPIKISCGHIYCAECMLSWYSARKKINKNNKNNCMQCNKLIEWSKCILVEV